jgi:hypothetical protein
MMRLWNRFKQRQEDSFLKEILSGLSPQMQVRVFRVIKEEKERWAKKELTEQEKESLDRAYKLGKNSRKMVEKLVLECFSRYRGG